MAMTLSSMAKKASAASGSKWLPLPSRMTAIDFSKESGSLYGRLDVKASNTSAIAVMRAVTGISFPLRAFG